MCMSVINSILDRIKWTKDDAGFGLDMDRHAAHIARITGTKYGLCM
jgi:hypothetical protein